MKVIVAYIPVLHQGYIEFLEKYKADRVYVLGKSITHQFRPLQKDIRALSPEMIVTSLRALKLAKEVQVIEEEGLQSLTANEIIMPDEEICRHLAEKYLADKKIVFDSIFLRWDSQKSLSPQEVMADSKVTTDDLTDRFLIAATAEAQKSADWWRQIGAVIVKDGQILFSGHNRHLPSEQQPYIDGDPRADFHKGEHIDKSTALHAEAGLIVEAAKQGVSLTGASLYVTTFPCPNCAKLVAHSGIKEVYFREGYAMVDGERVMRDQGVKIIKVE